MTKYKVPFAKTVFGWFVVEGKNKKEALKNLDKGDILGEFDNKTEYFQIDREDIEEE